MSRCAKHDPVVPTSAFHRLRGEVECAKCGRKGMYSRGQRKFGRPPRIIWFRATTSLSSESANQETGA